MGSEPDADEQLHDALHELADAAESFVEDLTILTATLRDLQAGLGPAAFEEWPQVTAGLDQATRDDFLALDGDLASVTDRMMAAFVRVVGALN